MHLLFRILVSGEQVVRRGHQLGALRVDWESVPLVRSPLWREHLIRGQNHEAESAVQKFSSVAPNGSLDCGRCRPGLSGCCIEGNKVPACVASCVCVCVACVTILHTHTHTQECREEVESRVRGRARDLCRVARLRVILRRSR